MLRGCHGTWIIAAYLSLLLFGPALAQPSGAQRPAAARKADGLLARHGAAPDFGPVTFQPESAPFPLRHNNYVGIKRPGTRGTWPGQTGADRRRFAMFDDPVYSIWALMALLRTYQDRYGDRSAQAIFRHLSPPGDCSGAPQRHAAGKCPENDR